MGADHPGREYPTELKVRPPMTAKVPSLRFPGGETIPVLGQGTWQMADSRARHAEEIHALQAGVDLGMTLIDTAEMYGSGAAEELVGEALADRRDGIFLVSKVLPENASRQGTIKACERSLKRLRTDRLDLYLLHWRGSVPLAETVEAFEALKKKGSIRHWGVSNFDVDDMEDLVALAEGKGVATNQVLYNLGRRGIERDLIPWSEKFGLPIMAYSPVDQGRLLRHPALVEMGQRLNATPAQLALAWLLHQRGICSIPKAGSVQHVKENHVALALCLTANDLAAFEAAFPPPKRKIPLEMI